jgi:hypothetical protein
MKEQWLRDAGNGGTHSVASDYDFTVYGQQSIVHGRLIAWGSGLNIQEMCGTAWLRNIEY